MRVNHANEMKEIRKELERAVEEKVRAEEEAEGLRE